MAEIEDLGKAFHLAKTDDILDQKIEKFILDLGRSNPQSSKDVKEKMTLLRRKYSIGPKKIFLFKKYKELLSDNHFTENKFIRESLITKEMRGQSGVIVISVITSPYPEYIDSTGKKKKGRFSCKHDCFYCPKEVDENGRDINPRSYLSDEPTVARGLQNGFDPVLQFDDRGNQYVANGHPVDKIEIIVLGGTWTEYPREYQKDFITKLFWAANTFGDKERRDMLSLEQEHAINSKLKNKRIIGLTLEMRPDSINEEEIHWLRQLGCTRIQLGVQHTDDSILARVNRGCTTEDAKRALRLLKDSCFKVDAHLMPDLPNSSPEIDKKMFKEVIFNSDLQFDQLKIYPTATVPWTKIKKWFDEGLYTPYTDINPQLLIDVLLSAKVKIRPYMRLNRVIRDIPNKTRDGKLYIYGGNKVTNLRQILHNELAKEHKFCKCIRCREVKNKTDLISESRVIIREYPSSGGIEYFISIETGNTKESYFKGGYWYSKDDVDEPGIIYGFLRLRISKNAGNEYFPELRNTGLIRELHIYGQVVTNNKKNIEFPQHRGFGKRLMKVAEYLCLVNNYSKVSIISGIGVRGYYKSLGYKLINTFMIKDISWNVKRSEEYNHVCIDDSYQLDFLETGKLDDILSKKIWQEKDIIPDGLFIIEFFIPICYLLFIVYIYIIFQIL